MSGKRALYCCPQCGQVFEGNRADAGAEAECEACGASFQLELEVGRPARRLPAGGAWYLGCLRRYACFRGRARRREYWWSQLFEFLVVFVAGFVDAMVEADEWVIAVVGLATLLPMLAVTSRRLHDTGKSAWWMLLPIIPVVHLAYFVWLLQKGDEGRNRFGPDPKASIENERNKQ